MRVKPSILVTIVCALAVIVIRFVEDQDRYTFGHPHAVDVALVCALYLLGITHVVLATIMWFHRRHWLPSESAMFTFVAIKAVFWLNTATSYHSAGGIKLDNAVLFVFMVPSTLWLDWTLFERYLRGSEDASIYGNPDDAVVTHVPGERRSGLDRRRNWGQLR